MNLKHNSPATKVTDTTNIFWVAAALCWQSAGCNYIGPTQTRPAFYWLQLHWGKYDILTEFRVCCSSVRMKQLQFLLSNNRGPEVFARKKTPTINCHQNDNYHDHHWDETLRTVPVASESIRFYISTYSARFTLMNSKLWAAGNKPHCKKLKAVKRCIVHLPVTILLHEMNRGKEKWSIFEDQTISQSRRGRAITI